MPRSRTALAGFVVAAVGLACAPARPRLAATAAAPDPERWERSACLRGEYPPDVDEGAYARARLEDVRAKRNGDWSTFASARLLDRRREFQARCEGWKREAEAGAVAAKRDAR